MADQTDLNYAAQITISLPGEGEQVSLTVTLWPADVVDVDGVLKPLGECTLADLERYAEELEADVWDTYESIVLPELDKDGSIEVDIKVQLESADEPGSWQELNLVLPLGDLALEEASSDEEEASPSGEEEDESADEDAPSDEAYAGEEGEEDEVLSSEGEVPSDDGEAPADEEGTAPDVAVAETEPVFPEIEEEITGEIAVPEIVPSQARVRVAGKRLPLNDPTWAAVDILIDEPAFRAAQAHAMSSLHAEVAGVLVGSRPEKQPDGRYVVHIFDTIIARHTVMQGASVTYTPESWRYLNDTLAERYPDDTAVMVGWYHTHPGFGIFLSGMDLFIHQNFFTQIWHVALVLDPRARTSGFFCWDRQKSHVGRSEFVWPKWAAGSW
jgi:proteasome lid subunit RPN8/RPN11